MIDLPENDDLLPRMSLLLSPKSTDFEHIKTKLKKPVSFRKMCVRFSSCNLLKTSETFTMNY